VAEEEKDKPAFDEQTLAKLLEAAFVLQEHNLELRKLEANLEHKSEQIRAREQTTFVAQNSPQPKPRPDDYTITLAQIVESQRQIQARGLGLEEAMSLVAARVMEIANAGGAAIGILEGKKVSYHTVAGQMTLPEGTQVAMEKALCVASLRTGQVIRCSDVNAEFLLDVEECQRRGIQSMIAVPVYHEAETAGGLELYYSTAQAFTEQDVHTCQLMAGLVTEALSRSQELMAKKSLANERAVMKGAIERSRPSAGAPADVVGAKGRSTKVAAAAAPASSAGPRITCRSCGHRLTSDEQFCGKCGTPRVDDYGAPTLRTKVAPAWQAHEPMRITPGPEKDDFSAKRAPGGAPNIAANLSADIAPHVAADIAAYLGESPIAASVEESAPGLFEIPDLQTELAHGSAGHQQSDLDEAKPVLTITDEGTEASNEEPVTSQALTKTGHAWNSAVTARDFLEQLAGANRPGALARFWNARRGDIYLAIAVIFVAGVIRWGIWSSHPVGATGGPATPAASNNPDAANPDLSFFDRLLISLGLADAPPVPEHKGNPDLQVWVDLHTALYYCPGSDLYGKTPKGKFTTQRDAQLDQYEPALRKVCE